MASSGKRFSRVPAARLREVAEIAEAVAEEYFAANGRIDLYAALRGNDITWSFGNYDDAFDGMLEQEGGTFHVYCNLTRVERESSERARFTLGHELGHFYIDEHRRELLAGRNLQHGSKCEYESGNPVEQEADHFASNLLMPADRFRRAAKGYAIGLDGVLGIAKSFGTSITSTAIRYASLGIKPCGVIKWSCERQFQWRWLSDEARLARYWKTIDSIAQVPADSPTGRALAGEQPENGRFFHAGTTASAWFPFVAVGSYKDIILIEQAMLLGRFGVLTFVYPPDGEFPHFE